MLEFAFWLLYLATPVIMVFLLKLAGEQVNRISVINIVVLSIYTFSIIGTMPLFYHWDEYRADIGVVDQTLIFEILLYSSVNLIFLLVGVIFVRAFFRLRPKRSYPVIKQLGKKQLMGLFAVLFLSVAITFFYISQLDSVALFVALSSGIKEAGVSRSLMGNDFSGKYHWYRLFMNDISQFIVFALFANYLVNNSKRGLIYFSSAFLFSTFTAIMSTEKGPLVWLLIGLLLVYFLVKRNGVIPIASALKFSVILVGALILMYIFFMGSSDISSAFFSIFSRAFTGQITPAYFYLEYFPSVQNYLWGGTFPNPGGLLPHTPFSYTVEIMNWVFPNLAATGVVGSMPTVFWGESYGNFGPLGIPITALFVGIMLTFISWAIGLLKWSAISMGFVVWAIIHYKDLSGSGFSGFFVDTSVFVIFLIVYLINSIGYNAKLKIRSVT
jgi:oligosaccharide repeat unit polymerase